MKLKALKNFQDVKENVKRMAGDIFEVSTERGEELLAHPAVIVERILDVEVLPETETTEDLNPPFKNPEEFHNPIDSQSTPIDPLSTPEAQTVTEEAQQEGNIPVDTDTNVATKVEDMNPTPGTPETIDETPVEKSKSQQKREEIMKSAKQSKPKRQRTINRRRGKRSK